MNQSRLKGLEQVLPQDTLVRGGVLAEYTTIKVGGAAGLMMEARDAQEVAAELAAALGPAGAAGARQRVLAR